MRRRLRSGHTSRQVPNPYTKLTGTDTLRIVGWIVEDAKHIVDKKICDRKSHTGKPPHEEVGRVQKILIERGETVLDRVNPWIAVIEPTRIWMSEDPGSQKDRTLQGEPRLRTC
jgi:hypothetical protein